MGFYPLLLLRRVRLTNFLAATLMFLTYAFTPTANAEEYSNFLGMEFVSIPSGSFKMGAASKTFDVRLDELPQRTVDVQAFQIMSTEVTLTQFKRYLIKSSRVNILTDPFMKVNSYDNNAPVVFISLTDVTYFLYWLNENKPNSDSGEYMLPTEAEWEYACRAGGNESYCGSEKASTVAWYLSKTLAYQQPVAQKKGNAFGLYDMSGNVREWVKDCYHINYETAPSSGREWTRDCVSRKRVVRGGSWNEAAAASRATDRLAASVNSRTPIIGFRVVRKVP